MARTNATKKTDNSSLLRVDPTPPGAPLETPIHDQVAQRAYANWERGGRQSDTADFDWKLAETELTGGSI